MIETIQGYPGGWEGARWIRIELTREREMLL